jgi:hypothetical protein
MDRENKHREQFGYADCSLKNVEALMGGIPGLKPTKELFCSIILD